VLLALAGAAELVFAGSLEKGAIACDPSYAYRSFDGSCNNLQNPSQGAVGSKFLHGTFAGTSYSRSYDQQGNPVEGPSARLISNKVFAAAGLDSIPSKDGIAATHIFWGQFLDHDLTHTATDSRDQWPIVVPADDPYIQYYPEGHRFMNFSRSTYVINPDTGFRDQVNDITSYIDGSSVYGSHPDLTRAVRLGDDICELNTTMGPNGEMLPRNYLDVDYDNPTHYVPLRYLFAAGDVRANENPGLTTLHTIFVREHNRQCKLIRAAQPELPGEIQFQKAREMVIALLQHVTFNEYIPATIGESIPAYTGYKENVDATVDLLFATALFRYGHSEVLEVIPRRDENGAPIPQGDLPLKNCYFNPLCWEKEGPEPILNGMSRVVQNEVDAFYVDAIRNFLFGTPSEKGIDSIDLGARNIQRGRDHGLPSYNKAREYFQLPAALTFADITSNASLAALLELVYDGDVNKVDAYVGALAEDHKQFPYIGDLMGNAIKYQYTCSRDGDRFYFENSAVTGFTTDQINQIKATRLSDIVLRNTQIQKLPCEMMQIGGELCGPGVAPPTPTAPSHSDSRSLLDGRYNVSWTITPAEGKAAIDDDAVIEFHIVAFTDAWVGFGFNDKPNKMVGSDVYISLQLENGTHYVDDYKIVGKAPDCANQGVCQDTFQGCTNDILASSTHWEAPVEGALTGTTTFTFSRKLVTGDKCDFPIIAGPVNVVAAMAKASAAYGALTYHSSRNRVPTIIEFLPAAPVSPPITAPAAAPTAAPSAAPSGPIVLHEGSISLFKGHSVNWTIVTSNPAATLSTVKELDPDAQILVSVVAKTDAWAGFGFNGELPKMVHSDVYIGIVQTDGSIQFNDYKIGNDKGVGCPGDASGIDGVCADTVRGCTNDLLTSSGHHEPAQEGEATGTLYLNWSRKLVTGDVNCDFEIVYGDMNVVGAMGKPNAPLGKITSHGPNKNTTKVALLGPAPQPPSAVPVDPPVPAVAPSGAIPVSNPSEDCPPPAQGEFQHELTALDGQYHLYWTLNTATDTLEVALLAQTTGWVGFGIANQTGSGGMVGSEAIIGWPGNVKSYILGAKKVSAIIENPNIPLAKTCSSQLSLGRERATTWTLVRATRSILAGNNPIGIAVDAQTKIVVAHGPAGATHLVAHEDDARTKVTVAFNPSTSGPVGTPTPVANPTDCGPVAASEYEHSLSALEDRYSLHWTMHPVESMMDLALVAKTTGWVGFGVSTSAGGMIGSEAIIGWPGSINSYHLNAKRAANVTLDSEIPLTVKCSAEFVADGSTWTVVRAHRSIVAGNNAISITPGIPTNVVVAIGPQGADYITAHEDDDRVRLQVDFMTGTVKAGKADPRHIAHGALMFVSWGIILQFGAFFARYAKPLPNALWFKLHRIIQFAGFGIAVAGFILALVMVGSAAHFKTSNGHAQIGLTVMILGIVQIVVAVFRPNPASVGQNKTIIRVLWEYSHWWIGRLALILAVANIFLGLATIKAPKAYTIAYAVIVGISAAVIGVLELYRKFAIDRPQQAYEFVKLSSTDPTN
jgi:uncharacterized membrane protein